MSQPTPESLARSLAEHYPDPLKPCLCEHEWLKSTGKLYGYSMGPGWVRTTTEPGCPHHVDQGRGTR